jgi:membrane protein DedA with SNARE-associated domain
MIGAAADFIAHHASWAGPVLALLTFGESIAVIGVFLPGTVLLLTAGGLAAAGVLDPVSIFVWSVAGAILGDAASWWLGARLGGRLLRHPLLARHRRLIGRTRLLTRRHGSATLFFGRFAGPLRAFVPIMAGVTGMPPRRFHPANVASALVWVAAYLAPGYAAARGASAIGRLGPTLPALAAAALLIALVAGLSILAWRARASLARRTAALTRPAPVRTPPAWPCAPWPCAPG